jgi:hypothetical protein
VDHVAAGKNAHGEEDELTNSGLIPRGQPWN